MVGKGKPRVTRCPQEPADIASLQKGGLSPHGTLSHQDALAQFCAVGWSYKIRVSRWGLRVSILKTSRGFQCVTKVKTTDLAFATEVSRAAACRGSLLEMQPQTPPWAEGIGICIFTSPQESCHAI